jgi:uncharacterized membrane protein
MRLTPRALLLLGAVVLFVFALFTERAIDMLAIGLALLAGASLVDELGIGRRRMLGR